MPNYINWLGAVNHAVEFAVKFAMKLAIIREIHMLSSSLGLGKLQKKSSFLNGTALLFTFNFVQISRVRTKQKK